MPHLTTLLFFAVATLVLTASPGPGVIYVAARTLSQGRRAGFASMVDMASAPRVEFCCVRGGGALSKRLLSSRIAQRRAGRVAAGTCVALGVVAVVSGEGLTR